MPDALLDDLDPGQRAAVTAEGAPLAILAPAGSGKTRVLTRRIAWRAREQLLEPRHVLAVTFTRKAAGELRDRLAALGVDHSVTAGTFHALALAQLRRRAAERGRELPGLLERKARVLGPLVGVRGAAGALAITEIAGEIEWAKARSVRPEHYEESAARAARRPSRSLAEVAELYARYEAEKKRRRLLDFDDLLWWCGQALETDAEFAASQRFRFRHLFVDEFQDVSPAQLRLVRAWLGDRTDLCAVGDDAQAIYGFAGADPNALRRFGAVFPGAEVVRLGVNYRSTPQIVAASAAALTGGSGVRRPTPEAVHGDGPVPTLSAHADESAEAAAVARSLHAAHLGGTPWGAMAILYRTNAQSAAFETALASAAVPFRVTGSDRFVDRPEVRATLDELRRHERATPGRRFADHLTDLAEDAATVGEEQREHLDALVRLGHEYLGAEGGGGSLDGFLAWLQAATRGEGGEAGDAVELLTFHKAKGLEWQVVFVTGLERGLVPISHAGTDEERAEEQRLLHVALSRAQQELHLSWAQERTIRTRTVRRRPSPYLDEIMAAVSPGARDRIPDPRLQLAQVRNRLHSTGGEGPVPDAELLAALKEWRRLQARAADVPAYVVFSDATLTEVAASRPRNEAELLDVRGVGPVKVERYGSALLELVARHRPSGG